ncbi:MAG TPA: type II toxin-antitoxin system VapC family toxin [Terracidiphilus sp.]|nr:type II toxin-antitoxin system VapC family toxin [Terracidiphilus sp.]
MSTIYLLDTNTVSYIAKGKSRKARARLEALAPEDSACISSITEAEIRYGLARRPQARALRTAIDGLLFKLRVLPWGSREAVAYGEVRAGLEAKGVSLAELDMLIAAHAISQGAVLVTTDAVFLRVAALHRVENWAPDI